MFVCTLGYKHAASYGAKKGTSPRLGVSAVNSKARKFCLICMDVWAKNERRCPGILSRMIVMNVCADCGHENESEAARCANCGSALTPKAPPRVYSLSEDPDLQAGPDSDVPRSIKWVLYLVPWGVVIYLALLAHLGSAPDERARTWDIAGAPFLPLGFLGLLPAEIGFLLCVSVIGAIVAICGGWVLYAALTAQIIRARRISTFVLFYALLCILLALNLFGCSRLAETASGLH